MENTLIKKAAQDQLAQFQNQINFQKTQVTNAQNMADAAQKQYDDLKTEYDAMFPAENDEVK